MTDRIETYHFHERDWNSLEEIREGFEWEVPEQFNIAAYTCDRWAERTPEDVALYVETADGHESEHTFAEIRDAANRMANHLETVGVGAGDRVGVFTPAKPAAAVTHLAAWKLGAVTVPLSTLFGTESVRYRLDDSGAVACVVDEQTIETFRAVRNDLNDLQEVLTVGDVERQGGERAFWASIEDRDSTFTTARIDAEDPAVIIYTSGTTGDPKGVVHAHRSLLGHLPSLMFTLYDMDVTEKDVVWSLAEWSWIAGLFATLFSGWYFGMSVLAYNSQGAEFDPHNALRLIEKYEVTGFFGVADAFRMMRHEVEDIDSYSISNLRGNLDGGNLDQTLVDWTEEVLGSPALNAFGQTEANILIGENPDYIEHRDGMVGKPLPGHEVTLVDPETAEPTVETNEIGEIAVRYEDDPVCMKEYWNNPKKTDEKIRNGWLLTEDLGRRDEDGYIQFVSRKDDVINYRGYRIGPEEIEEVLQTHDAVVEAGVAGVPSDDGGEMPKAFVVLGEGHDPSTELTDELQSHCKETLATYEYPREIEYMEEALPRTSTGKLRRVDLVE